MDEKVKTATGNQSSEDTKPENETDETEAAFFDVLDCVEETYNESEDSYSSDESLAESQSDTSSSDESKASGKDCSSSPSYDGFTEEVFETNENSDLEECCVADRVPNLSTKAPLPKGWKEAYHESGATIYVHPETNVCSLSRPYNLGTRSTKQHILPQTAIPCLNYREPDAPSIDELKPQMSQANQEKIADYCNRLFKFKKIKYLRFRSWDVRRSYIRTLRNERNRRKCPFSNKFITFPITKKDEDGNVVSYKKWIINPRGKSYVAILHEYLQQSLKTQPVYTFSEVDNARTPYAASVIVNGNEYGSGVGMSKKEAKIEAAKATLLVFLPKMKKYILNVHEKRGKKDESDEEYQNVASVFDDIEITDERVTKLSKKTLEPTPYELLLKCLRKKGEQEEVNFDFKDESQECTMSVGQHKVTIQCDNKRDGKQRAAQSLLQVLHPYINNWGPLLRLYSNDTTDQYQRGRRLSTDDREMEEVKNRAPNTELLEALQHRMLKLGKKE